MLPRRVISLRDASIEDLVAKCLPSHIFQHKINVQEGETRFGEESRSDGVRKQKASSASGSDEMAQDGVRVTRTHEFGRVLISTMRHMQGGIVLSEAPLVHDGTVTDDEVFVDGWEAWCEDRNLELASGLELLRFLKAFCAAPSRVREQVLECYQPPDECVTGSEAYRTFVAVANFASKTFKWASVADANTLRQVVLIKNCNAHEFQRYGSAVFRRISMARHCCTPNAQCTSNMQGHSGRTVVIALRDIEEGEQVTVSYVDPLWPTPVRQQHLRLNYFFECNCTACMQVPDMSRGLPCPVCVPRKSFDSQSPALLMYDHDVLITKRGYLYFDPRKESKPWVCNECGVRLEEPGICTFSEEKFVLHIISLDSSLDSNLEVDEKLLRSRFDMSMQLLGPRHWATIEVKRLLCQVWVKRINAMTFVANANQVRELQEGVDYIIVWLRERGIVPEHEFGEKLVFIADAMVVGGCFAKALEYYKLAERWASVFRGPSSEMAQRVAAGQQRCKKGRRQ